MMRAYLAKTWRDPRQEIRRSPIRGMGIFARAPIEQGEAVEIVGGQVMTETEFRAFQRMTPRYNAIQIGQDLHLVELPEFTIERGGSINHSCDSNLWMADEVTLVARYDIAAGDELTVDYALFTSQPDWVLDETCNCGALDCRHTITGNDWQRADVQARYYPHLSPFLNEHIRRLAENQNDTHYSR
jgi:uncharacterized protein